MVKPHPSLPLLLCFWCAESMEACHAASQRARSAGYHQRNRELLEWARRKRRLIRRDDLIATVVGQAPPEHSPAVACQCLASGNHNFACPLATTHTHTRLPSSFPDPSVPSVSTSQPIFNQHETASSRRRIAAGAFEDSSTLDSLRVSPRKRQSSSENLASSPKRSRFL